MPYLAGSFWMCINSAALDLDKPLEKLRQQSTCFIAVFNPILTYIFLAAASAKAFVCSISTLKDVSFFPLNIMTQFRQRERQTDVFFPLNSRCLDVMLRFIDALVLCKHLSVSGCCSGPTPVFVKFHLSSNPKAKEEEENRFTAFQKNGFHVTFRRFRNLQFPADEENNRWVHCNCIFFFVRTCKRPTHLFMCYTGGSLEFY